MAAHRPLTTTGNVTHADSASAPNATPAARARRARRALGVRKGKMAIGMRARYPVSKCMATVRATKTAAGSTARRDDMARHVHAQARGSVHDAHSWAHTPYPIQT